MTRPRPALRPGVITTEGDFVLLTYAGYVCLMTMWARTKVRGECGTIHSLLYRQNEDEGKGPSAGPLSPHATAVTRIIIHPSSSSFSHLSTTLKPPPHLTAAVILVTAGFALNPCSWDPCYPVIQDRETLGSRGLSAPHRTHLFSSWPSPTSSSFPRPYCRSCRPKSHLVCQNRSTLTSLVPPRPVLAQSRANAMASSSPVFFSLNFPDPASSPAPQSYLLSGLAASCDGFILKCSFVAVELVVSNSAHVPPHLSLCFYPQLQKTSKTFISHPTIHPPPHHHHLTQSQFCPATQSASHILIVDFASNCVQAEAYCWYAQAFAAPTQSSTQLTSPAAD